MPWAAYEAVYAESWKPEEGDPGAPAPLRRGRRRGRAACGSALARHEGAVGRGAVLDRRGRHRLHPQARAPRKRQAAVGRHHAERRAVRARDRPRPGRTGRLRHRRRSLQARLDGAGPPALAADLPAAAATRATGRRSARRSRASLFRAAPLARGAREKGPMRMTGAIERAVARPTAILRQVLQRRARPRAARAPPRSTADTGLFGHLPELDSMAVAGLLTEIEDRLGIVIEDDEVDGEMLETYGALLGFVEAKRAAADAAIAGRCPGPAGRRRRIRAGLRPRPRAPRCWSCPRCSTKPTSCGTSPSRSCAGSTPPGSTRFLPDLPGCNESLRPARDADAGTAGAQAAEAAAAHFGATHVLAIRGGALCAPAGCRRGAMRPPTGASLLRAHAARADHRQQGSRASRKAAKACSSVAARAGSSSPATASARR